MWFRIRTLALSFGLVWAAVSAAQSPTKLEPTKSAPAEAVRIVSLPPGPGPLTNPLKGWCSYSGPGTTHHEYSSLAFWYVSWRDLEPVKGQYKFAEWEATWDSALGSGKHVVLRVYLDYPGTSTGVPQWLIDQGCTMTPYNNENGQGLSPDYAYEPLVVGLEKLIAAMGARYNNNPRVACIQAGLLGFWGEWHTYPDQQLWAPLTTQERVLAAYKAAFPDKIVQARRADIPRGPGTWLGYHDDSLPYDTDCAVPNSCNPQSWLFLPNLRWQTQDTAWQTRCIAGELVSIPSTANSPYVWLSNQTPVLPVSVPPPGQTCWDFTRSMTSEAHFSWIGPWNPAQATPAGASAFGLPPAEFTSRVRDWNRQLGYEFRLDNVSHVALRSGKPCAIKLAGHNRGVAPFYYPWPVELALLDTSVQPAIVKQLIPTATDIRTWVPGAFSLSVTPTIAVPAGSYALAVGVRDPWKNVPSIAFANTLTTLDGWTILTTVKVQP